MGSLKETKLRLARYYIAKTRDPESASLAFPDKSNLVHYVGWFERNVASFAQHFGLEEARAVYSGMPTFILELLRTMVNRAALISDATERSAVFDEIEGLIRQVDTVLLPNTARVTEAFTKYIEGRNDSASPNNSE